MYRILHGGHWEARECLIINSKLKRYTNYCVAVLVLFYQWWHLPQQSHFVLHCYLVYDWLVLTLISPHSISGFKEVVITVLLVALGSLWIIPVIIRVINFLWWRDIADALHLLRLKSLSYTQSGNFQLLIGGFESFVNGSVRVLMW